MCAVLLPYWLHWKPSVSANSLNVWTSFASFNSWQSCQQNKQAPERRKGWPWLSLECPWSQMMRCVGQQRHLHHCLMHGSRIGIGWKKCAWCCKPPVLQRWMVWNGRNFLSCRYGSLCCWHSSEATMIVCQRGVIGTCDLNVLHHTMKRHPMFQHKPRKDPFKK